MARDPKDNQRKPVGERTEVQAEQRTKRRANRHKGDVADYANVGAVELLGAVVAVTNSNCAIQFGYTKDGSAFVVRIVGDGDPYNEFIRPSEDMGEYLTSLAADFAK
jgi:hypothetical protein